MNDNQPKTRQEIEEGIAEITERERQLNKKATALWWERRKHLKPVKSVISPTKDLK